MANDSTQDELVNENETESDIRRSSRINKGKLPARYDCKVTSMYEPTNYKEAIEGSNRDKWIEAMEDEMQAMYANNTWDLVELPKGRKSVGCKWVYKVKPLADGSSKYKARLVAKGFSQKYGQDYDEVFAPVVKQSTFRILLSVASYKNMSVNHIDIKTAFLNGDLDNEVYLKQPEGFEDPTRHLVCKLNKSLYGLKQSARCWNQKLNGALLSLGFRRGESDSCLYVKGENDDIIYLLVYVDDILVFTKDQKLLNDTISDISKSFNITDLGPLKLYLGIEVEKENNKFLIHQQNYINKILESYGMANSKASKIPLDVGYVKDVSSSDNILEPNDLYRRAIGSLLYLSNNTRPLFPFSVEKCHAQPKETGMKLSEYSNILLVLKI